MSRPRVFVARHLPATALASLSACDVTIWPHAATPPTRLELHAAVADADGLLALITDRVDATLLAAAPRLRVVANMAVGYDNVDLPALVARGVVLTNTPDVLTDATADMAWALLLAAARRVVEGQRTIAAGGWGAWAPGFLVGQPVAGATLGVVGAGRIGSAVLRRGRGFGMQLRYHNRAPSPALEAETGAQYRAFDDLLRESDFVVALVPLNETTREMFDARAFGLMKPTSVFVNTARGGVVDEAALAVALRAGRPWAAGLDVFAREPIAADHPLLALPNVVAAPHLGSATVAARHAMAQLAAQNIAAVLAGQPPLTPVRAG